MKSPSICIITNYTYSFKEIIDIVSPSIIQYCETHSYNYILTKYERSLKDFDKIKKVNEYLNDYDFIWALDGDAIITNHTIAVESFLDDEHELFLCKDINGINCGSFIIKNTSWAEWLIAWMLDLEGVKSIYCEQDALNMYLEKFPAQAERKVKFLPHQSINSYICKLYPEYDIVVQPKENWKEGDFVLHLPGVSNEKRLSILKEIKIIS